MKDLAELLTKAREHIATHSDKETVPVELGGELVTVVFTAVAGNVWADLTATSPPREGSKQDQNVGYNTDALAARYPLTHLTVDGQTVDEETWRGILEVLSSPSLKLIAAGLWGLNQLRPSQRIAALGKASAGGSKKKPSSPAN